MSEDYYSQLRLFCLKFPRDKQTCLCTLLTMCTYLPTIYSEIQSNSCLQRQTSRGTWPHKSQTPPTPLSCTFIIILFHSLYIYIYLIQILHCYRIVVVQILPCSRKDIQEIEKTIQLQQKSIVTTLIQKLIMLLESIIPLKIF